MVAQSITLTTIYRLTGESIANDPHGVIGTASYSYDPVGNRLNRSSSIAPVPSQSSTYDPNDRLTSDVYDNNGNTTSSSGNAYAYDFENHLTSLNNGAVAYGYDGDGNRVAKSVAGVTTNYLVDTNNPTGYAQVVEDLQGGAVVRSFTYGHDVLSARLGLMEILRVNAPSEFTYTVGIECASGEDDIIKAAIEVLESAPAGRWPISICPATPQFFTTEAIVFFHRQ